MSCWRERLADDRGLYGLGETAQVLPNHSEPARRHAQTHGGETQCRLSALGGRHSVS